MAELSDEQEHAVDPDETAREPSREKPLTGTDVKDEVSEKEQKWTERDDVRDRTLDQGLKEMAERSSTDNQAGAGICSIIFRGPDTKVILPS